MKNWRCFYIALICTFLLGIHDGYIALWKDGNPQPVQIYPYKAEFLPVADQKALEKGITVDDSRELAQLLEDYLS